MTDFLSSLSPLQLIIGAVIVLLALGLLRFLLRTAWRVISIILTLVVLAAVVFYLLNIFRIG